MLSKMLTAAVSLVIALVAMMGVGASASFAETHPFLYSFGSLSSPTGIAVDESSGNVYVADIETNTVYKFDANGNPVDFSALGSNTLTGAATPAKAFAFPAAPGSTAAIAVDNSTSPSDPSAGDLYVVDAGHGVVDKFNASGEYLGQITGPNSEKFTRLTGVAVDGNGNVMVQEVEESDGDLSVSEFDGSASNSYVRSLSLIAGEGGPSIALAIGPPGDMYSVNAKCGCVEKWTSRGEYLGRVDDNSSGDVAVAADWVTGHLYVDEQSALAEWDTGQINGYTVQSAEETKRPSLGALVSVFGSLQLTATTGHDGGIAVNSHTGDIYVSDPAAGTIDVFATTVPATTVNAPANVTETGATLEGSIDPRGTPVTECWFEYGTNASYDQSVECQQKPSQIGSGTTPVAVSAVITGLQPGLLYDFRLKVESANGPNFTSGRLATVGEGFGVSAFELSFANENGSPDIQAGSHPYVMTTTFVLNTTFLNRNILADREGDDERYKLEPDGNVRDVIVTLPPGLVGDPNATTEKCPLADLDNSRTPCPAASQIGYLEADLAEINGPGRLQKEPLFQHGAAPRRGGTVRRALLGPQCVRQQWAQAGRRLWLHRDIGSRPYCRARDQDACDPLRRSSQRLAKTVLDVADLL